MVGYGKRTEREAEWLTSCGESHICRGKGSEEWADMGRLLATWGHGEVLAWAAAKGNVWFHGPAAATVCMGIHGYCY